jgi:hypothetical protein
MYTPQKKRGRGRAQTKLRRIFTLRKDLVSQLQQHSLHNQIHMTSIVESALEEYFRKAG